MYQKKILSWQIFLILHELRAHKRNKAAMTCIFLSLNVMLVIGTNEITSDTKTKQNNYCQKDIHVCNLMLYTSKLDNNK